MASLDWKSYLVIGAGLIFACGGFLIARQLLHRQDDEEEADQGITPQEDPNDPFTKGASYERRRAARRRGNPVAVLITDAETVVDPVVGYVVDRSVTGLGLELEQEGEVEPGTVLSIRVEKTTTNPWIQVVVRNRRHVDGHWHLGCQFVKPVDYNSMMHFG
jgi:hypothetical protein